MSTWTGTRRLYSVFAPGVAAQESAAAACRALAHGDRVAVFDPAVVLLGDSGTPALTGGARSNG